MLTRLKDTSLAGFGSVGNGCRLRLGLEIGEIGQAEWALDHFEVKSQVGSQLRIEGVEQIAPELLTARARQTGAVPDRTECV